VVGVEDVLAWRVAAEAVTLHPTVRDYLVDLVRATRSHPGIRLGASPRAAVALARAARAWAWLSGRPFVVPDDVKTLAVPVLAHRILVAADADVAGQAAADLIRDVLDTVPVPTEVPA
jgi:MoxR-like ATPase